MSKPPTPLEGNDGLSLSSGLETLRSSREFRGPVEPLDAEASNDHIALVYESRREQFQAAVPFLRAGLENGERCMYIVDENSKAEVLAAMESRGIDVDAAIESGALTIHTKQDTYCRDGSFDPERMITFLGDTIDEATEEYDALRITGEMTWVFGEDPEMDDLLAYEDRLNELFHDEDCIALCQYSRERFPEEVIREIIRTHPHVVYDGTVCHNFYYTPPGEYTGTGQPVQDVDRMVETLIDRTHAKSELRERQEYLRRQNEITADPNRPFAEKLQALFDLGCERFDLDLGAMARVDVEADSFEVEAVSDDHEHFEPGVEVPLSETYRTAATATGSAGSVTDPVTAGHEDSTVFRNFGIRSHFGTYVEVEGGHDRTFFFVSAEPRQTAFSDDEHAFLRLMGRWLKYELEGRRREKRLTALNALNQSLMTAETPEAVTDSIVEAAESLDLPATSVALYDQASGELRPAAGTTSAERVLDPLEPFETGEGIGWRAFLDGTTKRATTDELREGDTESSVNVLAVPLCDNGAFVTAISGARDVDDAEVEFVETVAANAATALDRTLRERELRAREETLETQNETLTRLDRINTTIRSIDQALVSASTRTEIASVVCERLTEAGPYKFAWIGAYEPLTGKVTPEEWAGKEEGYLEAVVGDAADESPKSPAVRAAETRETQVVDDLLTDAASQRWRQEALNRGHHAAAAFPLVYEETMFGVLTVFADEPGVFDDFELPVLTEMGDNVAHAINAVENKRSLVSDEVTELEFSLPASGFPFGILLRELDCTVQQEGLVSPGGGELRWFLSIRGATADEIRALAPRLPVSELEAISQQVDDGTPVCLFEATLIDGGLPTHVLELGGTIREFRAEEGTASATVDLGAGADVREFVEAFQRRYGGAELIGKRERERPARTVSESHSLLTEELTPRQLEVIQTAYHSGYFEEPRTRTGCEIAESMGISQPTFTTHLRNAERKVYRELFDRSP